MRPPRLQSNQHWMLCNASLLINTRKIAFSWKTISRSSRKDSKLSSPPGRMPMKETELFSKNETHMSQIMTSLWKPGFTTGAEQMPEEHEGTWTWVFEKVVDGGSNEVSLGQWCVTRLELSGFRESWGPKITFDEVSHPPAQDKTGAAGVGP